jgi:hypothetical protein
MERAISKPTAMKPMPANSCSRPSIALRSSSDARPPEPRDDRDEERGAGRVTSPELEERADVRAVPRAGVCFDLPREGP